MVMLSSPIISEVVIWYLQDGIYLGYGFTALAVLFGMELLRNSEKEGEQGKNKLANFKWKEFIVATGMLVIALGFYEAFMIVFLMGMVMNYMLIHALEKEGYENVKNIGGIMNWKGEIER
jgi:hypothetical protein